MVNEVSICKAEGTEYKVDMSPVHMVEDTYTKSAQIDSIPSYPEDAEDPETVIIDVKQTLHRFVITGTVPEVVQQSNLDNGIEYVEQVTGLNDAKSQIGRLRILYGYGNFTKTKLKFNYNGVDYEVFMTRLTMTRGEGEGFYEYIIELVEGIYEDDWE